MKASTLAWGAFALLAAGGGAYFAWTSLRAPAISVTLVPGRSVWEVADKLSTAGFGPRDAFVRLAGDEAWVRGLGLPMPTGPARPATWLEGFVYPDTYTIRLDSPPEAILERAARQFDRVWSDLRDTHADSMRATMAELGLAEADLIVLASLVEEEMALRSEAPRIAGVFFNRLRKGMRLETDPTLMYRPDRVGRPPTPAERRDRTNPYNTYVIKGLPPGPICSPGPEALAAVLAPERHNYFFFVAKRDGSRAHAFAATYEDHEANIERYLRKAPRGP